MNPQNSTFGQNIGQPQGIPIQPNQMPMPPVQNGQMPMPPVQPMGMQPGMQGQFAQSNLAQQQLTQQQILQQQQAAMQTANVNIVTPPALEGPQAIGSQDTTPKVLENPISTQSTLLISRSEERRGGKECRSRWARYR